MAPLTLVAEKKREALELGIGEMAYNVVAYLGRTSFSRDGLQIKSYWDFTELYLEIRWRRLLVFKQLYYSSQTGKKEITEIYRSDPVWIEALKNYAEEAKVVKHRKQQIKREKVEKKELDKFTYSGGVNL